MRRGTRSRQRISDCAVGLTPVHGEGEKEEEWVGRSSDFSATLRKSHLASDYLLEESHTGRKLPGARTPGRRWPWPKCCSGFQRPQQGPV